MRDTHRVMSEESTTPDLVALMRRLFEAAERDDFDAAMRFFASDAVWESMGLGTRFEGVAAIRGHFEDWRGAYEEYEMELEEVLDLGNGVVFATLAQGGRPAGSTGRVRVREARVATWVDGMFARTTTYLDIDEARAAAERLAEERGRDV